METISTFELFNVASIMLGLGVSCMIAMMVREKTFMLRPDGKDHKEWMIIVSFATAFIPLLPFISHPIMYFWYKRYLIKTLGN